MPPSLETLVNPNQLADTRTVDIRYLAQVQQNLLVSFKCQIPHGLAYDTRSFAEKNPAGNIDYRYIAHLAISQLHADEFISS